MDARTLLQTRWNDILRVAARHDARNVRVFASVARGEASPDSDIDLLVDLEPGRSLFDLGGLLFDLQTLPGVDLDKIQDACYHFDSVLI